MNLDVYEPRHIESFLLNYELLVRDLAEVATDWPSLDEEERSHYHADLMQTWGNRKVLGLNYGQVTHGAKLHPGSRGATLAASRP